MIEHPARIRSQIEGSKCPTCGSDDPTKPERWREGTVGGQMVGMQPRGRLYTCPDSWHEQIEGSNDG
jgi:hypothetical protein